MACLDDGELAALLEHQLSAEGLARLDDHVAACSACRDLVAELGRPGTTAIAFAATEPAPEKRDFGPLTQALAHARAEGRIGTTLAEKWMLDRVLGVGGMAQVFEATHRNGKKVAIKVLRPELGADSSVLARFLKEGYAANKVAHPGAVSVLDDGIADDGSAFLVMELLRGETLGQRLARSGPLSVDEAGRVALAILGVLDAAHDKGIVHRDIKPENVFLEDGGGVRLLDFGIARVREITQGRGGTEAGSILGTPSFMPPEQARGRWEEVDARSDLWAVGATMYTLLTGAPVRRAQTLNEELLAAMTTPVPPIRRALPALHPAVARVIDRSLALEQGARFASAREMQDALRHALAEATSPRARRPVQVAALVFLAAALGVVAVARSAPDRSAAGAEVRAKARATHAAAALGANEERATPVPIPATPQTLPVRAVPPPPASPVAREAASSTQPAPGPSASQAAAAPAREVLDRRH